MKENKTKHLIRKTAIQLFKEKGFDSVTIQEICLTSQISKHTFYYYFKSKDDLLKTITKAPIDINSETIAKILLIESPYEQYCALFKVAINHFEHSGKDLMRKILVAQLTSSSNHREPSEDRHIQEMMEGLIKKSQDRQEISNLAKPKALLQASFCLMIGVAQIWATHEGADDNLSKSYFDLLAILLGKNENK